MEWIAEAHVMAFLTFRGHTFVCPQFLVEVEGSKKYPDFVALDLPKKNISVVEVSTAYNIRALADKLNLFHRNSDAIRRQIISKGARFIDETWGNHDQGFRSRQACSGS
jgi:hypothetical protein